MPSMHRDGVRLFFEEAQGAGAPIVLVHGWCCDHTYLAPQLEVPDQVNAMIDRFLAIAGRPAAP